MNIKVKGLGPLKKYVKVDQIDIEPGTTCRDLIGRFAIPAVFKPVAFVNGAEAELDSVISEPCEVSLVTFVRGG